jgi:hypothetical protein
MPHDDLPRAEISRRAFLAATGTVVAGAAIATTSPAWARVPEQGSKALSPLVLSSDLYASPDPQRLAFAIAKGSSFASGAPAKVALAAPGAKEGPVYPTELHRAGLPKHRGVYVAEVTLDQPGVWNALAVTRGKQVPFAIQVNPQPAAPVVGAAAPRAASPTKADTLGVKPICTRRPQCPLHDVSLADVIGTGRPVAVMFATPALCQSQYCGPVLDELLDLRAPFADTITFVHVEIYTSNRGATRAPTVEAWNLPSEPWLYTVDGAGTIVGRLDGAFGSDEMQAQLEALAGA